MLSSIQKAMLSSTICTMAVWYELTLFWALEPIISATFFTSESSTIKFLCTFAVGYVFRPVGAFIFGYFGDKYGRRKVLLVSIVLISTSSTAIGLIPSFKEIGIIASLLLVLCRIMQGAAAGGEIGMNATFLIEHSSDKKDLGFLGGMKICSGAVGAGICFLTIPICKYLTGAYYEVWGWKILFYFCFLMGMAGFIIRYIISETPAYKTNSKNDNLSNSPSLELIKNYSRPFILAIGICIAQDTIIYAVVIFYNSIKELILLGVDIKNTARIISYIIFGLSSLWFATLSDKLGRKKVMTSISIVLLLIGMPLFSLLSHNNVYIVIFTYLLLNIPLGASFGIYSSFVCELFPTKVRCIGFSLATSIAAGIFGGVAPLVCSLLIEYTGTNLAAGIYLSLCALISLASVLQVKTQDRKVDW